MNGEYGIAKSEGEWSRPVFAGSLFAIGLLLNPEPRTQNPFGRLHFDLATASALGLAAAWASAAALARYSLTWSTIFAGVV